MDKLISFNNLYRSLCEACCGSDRDLCVSIPDKCAQQYRMDKLVKLLREQPVMEVAKGCKFCEDLDWMYEVVCYHPNDNGSGTDITINYCPHCGAKIEW